MVKIIEYLKNLIDEEVKDFAVINFGDCFKSTRKTLCSKLGKKFF